MPNPTQDAAIRGTGRVDDPIRGESGGCAYKGCQNVGGFVRATNAGYFVSYCQQHEREADRTFDVPDE